MQDQENLPEVTPPEKKPNLFHDWWEEMYPRDFFLTFKNYLFNHKTFFDEVFEEQWDDKVKPMAFLFTAIGLSLIIGAISPWGLSNEDEPNPIPALEAMLVDTHDNMGFNKTTKFINYFGIQDYCNVVDTVVMYDREMVNARLEYVTKLTQPLNAEQFQKYFTNNQQYELAARAEYLVLKEKMAHQEFLDSTEIGEVWQVILLNLFVLWAMIFWLLSHRFFKKANRTSRETVHVYMYGLGMVIFFYYVPTIAILGALDANIQSIGLLIISALFIIVLYRIFSIFKYTHNTGFWSLMKVYIKTILLAILYGIPILILIYLVLRYFVL